MHNSLHKMNFPTYGYTHIDLLCQMESMKHWSNLIIHKRNINAYINSSIKSTKLDSRNEEEGVSVHLHDVIVVVRVAIHRIIFIIHLSFRVGRVPLSKRTHPPMHPI